MSEKIKKSWQEWQHLLTPGQFAVTRKKATEPVLLHQFHCAEFQE